MITILLIIGFTYIVIRFISIKKQLRKIKIQLNKKERINIILNDKDVEKIAESFNIFLQEQKQLEINIRNREENLKQSISNISHDLRTPLTAIRGYITLLENCTEEERNMYIGILSKKSEELNNLLNNFYELSIFDNDSYQIDIKAIDIVEIIMGTVISNYALIKNKEIEIDNRLPSKPIEVQGEEVVCSRIIQNLVSNAIKYSTGYISIELKEFDEYVIFKIRNSVSDLTQDDLKYLFDRFYTADKSRNRSGSGLGLFIVKVLLDKIDGEVYEVSLNDDILSISILFRYF
ncbi:HAMP domain-containing sensor histidine kinase [Romboutsia sp. 1001216sp1]|uniref:sensor histidine kinase n=1 Tax=unclassified Romboutsia TaxID=2626894 RepID=UPI0018A11169|nr:MULTISPECIES: HAMP domain-containing sensor histidine kinase [unclassified Romboutsia]MDB8789170.1 HAMP domain-containing sensor histidine kinase [Romboutsia sp. 1001216sp1]MDB8793179.1 HAMP domain-containing sensor histidine kinase [Romboutsia sp. 1001216sp1]MDB8795971.1 HAMP domain-containing sensor histidine kinase [Romboutsia sp. 1001216sp1]MDB8799467.1 HAMP domain-containing sensor histidine kinase [Romboutsia sp. 1001216sp1]MDB8802245.1 HAMP domain-containing sensor histidine kinase [